VHLDQLARRLPPQADKGLVYRLFPGATLLQFQEAESRLAIKFPEQPAIFWTTFNGFKIIDPPFQIFPIEELIRERDLLIFSTCNEDVRIAFDIRSLNSAGQWSIINADTNYQITLTMASYWSTHMWSWIAKHRPIWFNVHPPNDEIAIDPRSADDK
jgi:hypothetical protein